jgi:phi LC3 family holin
MRDLFIFCERGIFMKINWKVRFKNRVWLTSFVSLIIGFIFSMLTLFDIYPSVTETQVVRIINQVLTFLGLVGVLVDPTTAGLGDSERALGYEEPWDDSVESEKTEEDGR